MSNGNFQNIFLKELSNAVSYNDWIVEKFEFYLGKSVLEIGGGIGNFSRIFRKKGKKVWVSEVNNKFLKKLRKEFENVLYLDIEKKGLAINRGFDSVVMVNVLEHIKDRSQVLKNCKKLLNPRGFVIILVPSHNFLYGTYDKNVGHFLRYTKDILKAELEESGLKSVKMEYCNKLGALGWYVNACLLKKDKPPKRQVKLMNVVTPFLDFIDYLIPGEFGLSLICVAKKS